MITLKFLASISTVVSFRGSCYPENSREETTSSCSDQSHTVLTYKLNSQSHFIEDAQKPSCASLLPSHGPSLRILIPVIRVHDSQKNDTLDSDSM